MNAERTIFVVTLTTTTFLIPQFLQIHSFSFLKCLTQHQPKNPLLILHRIEIIPSCVLKSEFSHSVLNEPMIFLHWIRLSILKFARLRASNNSNL